jgi:hypothetical protein
MVLNLRKRYKNLSPSGQESFMSYDKYTPEKVTECGETFYKKQLQAQVEAAHQGEFLVLDIETGDYEIAADDVTATQKLLARRPQAVIYGLRIGAPIAYRVGSQGMWWCSMCTWLLCDSGGIRKIATARTKSSGAKLHNFRPDNILNFERAFKIVRTRAQLGLARE